MSDTPEGGFTLEFIGRAILGLQQDVRTLQHDMRTMTGRLDEIQEEQLRQSAEITTLRLDTSAIRERMNKVGAAWQK